MRLVGLSQKRTITIGSAFCLASLVCLGGVQSSLAQERTRRAQSPREMLDVMQIDASQLKHFIDDRPILGEEQEPLEKVLFRLPMFAQADVDRWATPITELDAMFANPDSYRFEMYELRGEVKSLRKVEVIPEMAKRLGYREFYEVSLSHDEVTSIVYVRSIPSRWDADAPDQPWIDESVRIQGLMLKRISGSPNRQLAFAAARLNWHPKRPSESLGVSNDQVLLGQLGVDIDRLTEVEQRAAIVGEDRECFYQMLAAIRLAEPKTLAKVGRSSFDIGRLIRTPQSVTVELYTLRGLARRAIKIHVEDQDIPRTFWNYSLLRGRGLPAPGEARSGLSIRAKAARAEKSSRSTHS